MNSSYDPSRVLQVACPSCEAAGGEQCKTKTGKRRSKDDFHANRKGIVFPAFSRRRRGLSDPNFKVTEVVDAIEGYVSVRLRLSQCKPGERTEIISEVSEVRDELFEALKEAFQYAKHDK